MPETQTLINEFVTNLRKRKIDGSQATALRTAELLRSVISHLKAPQANQASALIDAVKNVGVQLIAANPAELATGNIVRRVLHIIREEELSLVTNDEEVMKKEDSHIQSTAGRSLLRQPSLHTLLDCKPDSTITDDLYPIGEGFEVKGKSSERSSKIWKLKNDVIEGINELIQELNNCHEHIAEQAVELIHQNEVILTLGRSRTVMEFLFAAKEKRRSFRVFVVEGAPKYHGHVLARELAERGLQTTLIPDSAVFAMISRVNMVIVGVHAVMANGGVLGQVGLNMVALAARKHAVPFVVVAGTHKLCPLYPQDPRVILNEMKCPSDLLDFGGLSDCLDFGNGSGVPLIHIVNPAFDYVPPELVSLFITDIGGHNPSFMFRLLADYYSANDLIL
ncbi:translation initiation factor eIF-2B subunit beta isoform X1 [Ricinus communis]|nr:translation initiation factor eIF-2B subunit beta isoform X1 [Ricinus communis]|eukprot:XP_015580628.1 translation initiation factor eIF-2B subunit beta isoform X1 [Ricinus communis]